MTNTTADEYEQWLEEEIKGADDSARYWRNKAKDNVESAVIDVYWKRHTESKAESIALQMALRKYRSFRDIRRIKEKAKANED